MQLIPLNHFQDKRIMKFLKGRGIDKLNSIQTQVYTDMFESFSSLFLGAPGNSGKMTTALLLAGKLLIEDKDQLAKVLYLLPFQELLDRKLSVINQFCDAFGRKIGILTGNTNSDIQTIEKSSFIVSTAEHWDNITRRWQTKRIKKLIRPIR